MDGRYLAWCQTHSWLSKMAAVPVSKSLLSLFSVTPGLTYSKEKKKKEKTNILLVFEFNSLCAAMSLVYFFHFPFPETGEVK